VLNDLVTTVLLFIGSAFLLLAAVGVIRMPDLYSRIQAAAKAASLGAGFIVLALAVHFADFGTTIRSLLVIAFIFLTAPVAGHVIGRAAYFVGVPLWEHSIIDELQGHYDAATHALECPEEMVLPVSRQENPPHENVNSG
jgi:multicomponent Na+:H+ antiporter subunit G